MLVVKRKGHKEKFDERKVYGSVYGACMASGFNEKKCEKMASDISKDVKKWIGKEKVVGSDDIFRHVIRCMKKHSKEAAFMYETHRDIS